MLFWDYRWHATIGPAWLFAECRLPVVFCNRLLHSNHWIEDVFLFVKGSEFEANELEIAKRGIERKEENTAGKEKRKIVKRGRSRVENRGSLDLNDVRENIVQGHIY